MPTYYKETLKTSNKPYQIKLDHVSVKYGAVTALKDISLEIKKNSFLYVIGPNGAGKSTFIKLLVGALKPSSGSLDIQESDLGYLPQVLNQKPYFPITVNEVIYSGFKHQSLLMKKSDRELIQSFLEKMDIAAIGNQLMSTLSGGQQQRVFLIRALISNPTLLILDEPTSALDSKFRYTFYQLLDEIHKRGTTIIFVTHDLHGAIQNDDDLILNIDQTVLFYGSYRNYKETVGHRHV